jgi:hypothetical protein
MLLRLLRSIIFGVGLAFCVAILFIVVLTQYNRFFSPPVHMEPGVGAVAGGLYPLIWLMPPAFIAGFIWQWKHSSSNRSHG